MLEFIVLGIVPGDFIQITFLEVMVFGAGLLLAVFIYRGRHSTQSQNS